jgi:hypothetical protein
VLLRSKLAVLLRSKLAVLLRSKLAVLLKSKLAVLLRSKLAVQLRALKQQDKRLHSLVRPLAYWFAHAQAAGLSALRLQGALAHKRTQSAGFSASKLKGIVLLLARFSPSSTRTQVVL